MIDQRFGRWTVIADVESNKQYKRYLCRCDCGNITTIIWQSLKEGTSTQCKKCYTNRSHLKSKTSTYNIWSGLFTRCYNPNHVTYKYYGAKGITVTDEWRSFENFLKDMGERPFKYQIDRIDATKGYYKENCRWISKKENTKRQRSRLVDITGMKFGKWTVIDRDMTKLDRDQAYWNCICDCGTKASRIGGFLRSGNTKQCKDCKDEAHIGWGDRLKLKDRNNER